MCVDCKYYQGKCTNTNGCAEKEELQQVRADVIEEYKDALIKVFTPIETGEEMDLEIVILDIERIAKKLNEQI